MVVVRFIRTIIKDIARFIFWYPGRLVIPMLPLKITYFMADVIGSLRYFVSRSKREIIIDELSRIFGGKKDKRELQQTAKRGFKIMSKDRIEVLLYSCLTKEMIDKMATIEGLERLDEALSKGLGVILLIAHFGANKMVMPALGFKGYRINQIAGSPIDWGKAAGYTSPMSKRALELELEGEKKFPASFIYITNSIRPAIKCLNNNEILCMAIDGGGGTKRVRTNFLSQIVLFSPNFINISRSTNSIVLPAFVLRQRDSRHRIIIEEPIRLELDGDEGRVMEYNTQKFTDVLSRYFEQYPCHYTRKLLNMRLQIGKDPVPFFNRPRSSAYLWKI